MCTVLTQEEQVKIPVAFLRLAVKLQSLTLREEHRLRISENKVLRRILAATRNEKIEVGVLQNEELHNLHTSPNIITMIK
jgi:hypothetical protein